MTKFTDIQEILRRWLGANGYDGLYNDDLGCVCVLDDLIPCDGAQPSCEAGYKVSCDCGDEDSDWQEHDFHIVSKK